MLKEKLSGVGVAMVTPFTESGQVDYKALGDMVDYVIDGGVDYIVALGTTAETPMLYNPERAVIAMYTAHKINGRVPLVMGCGGNSTSEVLDQLREFDLRGADAILSVTPYYNKPSQEGLYQHFKTVAEHSPLPVILYNIPGRTGVNMTAETTLRLAREIPNIIGIKENGVVFPVNMDIVLLDTEAKNNYSAGVASRVTSIIISSSDIEGDWADFVDEYKIMYEPVLEDLNNQ